MQFSNPAVALAYIIGKHQRMYVNDFNRLPTIMFTQTVAGFGIGRALEQLHEPIQQSLDHFKAWSRVVVDSTETTLVACSNICKSHVVIIHVHFSEGDMSRIC